MMLNVKNNQVKKQGCFFFIKSKNLASSILAYLRHFLPMADTIESH